MKKYLFLLLWIWGGVNPMTGLSQPVHFVNDFSTSGDLSEIKNTPVATKKGNSYAINYKALSKTMPGKETITSYKINWTKHGQKPFLARLYKRKSVLHRQATPLIARGNGLYVDMSNKAGFVDCWLMECTTCEEDVSGTGMVHCVCLGGETGDCGLSDVSYPVNDILEKLFE